MHDAKHVLPERLKPGLKLVFCGTAAGRQSALQKAYYAHSQNKFWRTLHEVGLTPHLFAPKDYPALWDLGIGLTDIAKHVYGMDHQLPKDALGPEAVAALKSRILKAK
ncbi:MAG: mismatch-specific DNA-glycosylase, partial [Rhizomicrobium sp.]